MAGALASCQGTVKPAETTPVTQLPTEQQTEAPTETADTDKATEGKTEAKTEAKTEVKTEAKTEAKTEPKTEPVTEKQTEPATEPATEPVKTPLSADIFDLKIDKTACTDQSKSKYEITPMGTIVVQNDKYGSYLHFAGDSHLKIASFNSYEEMAKGFTAEMTVRMKNDSNACQDYFSSMHAGGFGYEFNDGILDYWIHIGGAYVVLHTTPKYGEVVHYVFTYNGKDKVCLYANGVLVDSADVSGAMGFPTAESAKYMCVGADSNEDGNGEYPCYADIYSARLYPRAATAEEVTELYGASPVATAMDKADLFDLGLTADGYADLSDNHYEIGLNGAPVSVKSDANGYYLNMNGTSNLKVSGYQAQMAKMGTGFTCELTMRMTNLTEGQDYFGSMDAGGFGFEYNTETGKLEYWIHTEGTYQTVELDVEANKVMHIVVTYNGSVLTAYLNGAKVAEKTVGGNFKLPQSEGAQYLCIGGDSEPEGVGSTWQAYADIYEARMYSKVATAEQVLYMYQESAAVV